LASIGMARGAQEAWRDQRIDAAAGERVGSTVVFHRSARSPEWKPCSSPSQRSDWPSDRTQLLSLVLAACYCKPWPIIAGMLVATIANHTAAGMLGA
jgi:hypothetical protein